MLTPEESEKFFNFINDVKLEDFNPPEPPKKLSQNHPFPSIAKKFNEYIDTITYYQSQKIIIAFGIYEQMVSIANRLRLLFQEPSIYDLWCELYTLDADAAEKFISTLFSIENDYHGALGLIQKQKNEKKCYQQVIEHAQKLYNVMEEYFCHYYGHMLQENHFELMDKLDGFIKSSKESLDDFEPSNTQSIRCDLWPLSRKTQGEQSLEIFFIRKIYLAFNQLFNKPMYSKIAKMIHVIFNSAYDDDHIRKICVYIKTNLAEAEDS